MARKSTAPFIPMTGFLSPLPIDNSLPDIVRAVCQSGAAVVVAPPGSGKTTRLAPALAEALETVLPADARQVVLLQPRRMAARAAAARIAHERSWRLGDKVGFQIRFENRTTRQTQLRIVTEGILTRQIQHDPFLEGVACLVLDEFHERSIHADLALALVREIRETVRPDLRIVVMSATMDPAPVAEFLGGASVFKIEGRPYPVEMEWLARTDPRPVWERAAEGIRRALALPESQSGHILVFLPGMGEIRRTASLLESETRRADWNLHILHSSVAAEDQDRALLPSTARKVILATNIAETSLTIDGVRTVIDSGMVRILLHDGRLGIDRLELRRVSRASADQRAGRAGRTAPGRCLRLWTREEEIALEPVELPEIRRVDIAPALLALRIYGVRDITQFRWFEAPRPEPMERASQLLLMLGAVDAQGNLTDKGRALALLPLHPRLGCLLMAGEQAGWARDAAGLAALLSERDLWMDRTVPQGASGRAVHSRQAQWHSESDLLDRLEWLDAQSPHSSLDPQAMRTLVRVRDELLETLKALSRTTVAPKKDSARTGRNRQSGESRDIALRKALLQAYPDRVTLRRLNDSTRGVMVGGRGVLLDPSCAVRRALLFLSIDPRDAPPSTHANKARDVQAGVVDESRLGLASAIEAAWLPELFPHMYKEIRMSRFDAERAKVVSVRQVHFCGLMIREDLTGAPADYESADASADANTPPSRGNLLYEAIKDQAAELFSRDEAAARWLARVAFLCRFMPELGLPEFDPPRLSDALANACAGCRSLEQAQARGGLRRALESSLTFAQRQALERHAPECQQVPSGSHIKLEYPSDGAPPVLAVRLQEVFGLAETPRIASGRVGVVLHLLGPNYRPVQVTSDLRNFWQSTYAEIRRELRARYPRHPWPEDPWNAPPVAVGGRKRKPG